MERLKRVKEALLTVGVPVSHYQAKKQKDKYIVWAEDSAINPLWADGKLQDQVIQGTIHYFTFNEYDPNIEKIQQALNAAYIPFKLNAIQYENDTKYIHYEWVWDVV